MSWVSDRRPTVALHLCHNVLCKIMSTVDLDELLGAVDWVSTDIMDNEAFICRETGRIYWISSDSGLDEEVDQPPDDVEDPDKFVPVPTRHDLDIGNRVALEFTAQRLPERYEQVRGFFRRKGAYGRFKRLLAQEDLLEPWYAYSEESSLNAIRQWCETEKLSTGP